MSISLIVTKGFGNGTLLGAIKEVVTSGYDIGIQVISNGYLSGDITMFSVYNGTVSTQSVYSGITTVFNAMDQE